MKKVEKFKRALLVLFVMVGLMLSHTSAVYADERPQEPTQQEQTQNVFIPKTRYSTTPFIYYGATITGSTCTTGVTWQLYNSTDKVYVTANLQKLSSNGTWTTIKTYTSDGKGVCYMSENMTVSRGTYRVTVSGSVYNSNGTFLERVSGLISDSKIY